MKAYNLYVFSFLSERKNAYLEILGIKYYDHIFIYCLAKLLNLLFNIGNSSFLNFIKALLNMSMTLLIRTSLSKLTISFISDCSSSEGDGIEVV